MSKRLQVLVDEGELREIQRIARAQKMTVAEWARQALRQARKEKPLDDATKKLHAVRSATKHAFPTGDIEEILAEIEKGYSG